MAPELSDYQKERKAKTIIERLALKNNLDSFREQIAKLIKDASIEVADLTSPKELEELIIGITNGTTTNNKVSRFLELAKKLGID